MILTPKFYLFDIGIANHLARRQPRPGTPEFGKSIEHLVLMELMAYRAYRSPDLDIRYWRTSTGQEVDFLLNDREAAIEVKSSARVSDTSFASLTALSGDGPVRHRIVVSLERQSRQVRDRHGAIRLLPLKTFLEELWAGKVAGSG